MKLYDSIIRNTLEMLSECPSETFLYNEKKAWKDLGQNMLIMQRDSALELGGSGNVSLNYTLVTTEDIIPDGDSVTVVGKKLEELNSDVSFARITILKVNDLHEAEDQEKAYNAIRDMEFVRYHVFPEGYMVRVSSESNQERVRISKDALKKGITFESVGDAYIKKYKELPTVKNVKMIFVCDRKEISGLVQNAKKTDDITKTLTHILDGLNLDCGHCSLKPVCDEVEGMRELHMGKKK